MHSDRGTPRAPLAIGGLLIAVTLPGCSLILDFDDPPPPPDAMEIDAIADEVCEFGEPNELRTAASPLVPPVTGQVAGICSDGDRDFYSFPVTDGATVTIQVLFQQQGGSGDLDLRLYDEAGATVARSLSTDADEAITCPGDSPLCPQLTAGNYFIEIFGFAATTRNGYTLNITVDGGT